MIAQDTELDTWFWSLPMTATQSRLPVDAPAPAPIARHSTGRVPVATTLVVFAIVIALLTFIALVE